MTHLDLKIDENDPEVQEVWGRYSDMKAFHIIRRYLDENGDLSIKQTIKALHDMLPERTEDRAETQHSNFSHTVLDIVEQIPYSHPAHERLARLLHGLQRSSKLTDRVVDEEDVSQKTRGIHLYPSIADTRPLGLRTGHSTLTSLNSSKQCVSAAPVSCLLQFAVGACQRIELIHSAAGFEASTPEEEHAINISSFLARLCSYGMFGRPLWAIWTLRLYLEYPNSDDCYSGSILIAAVWIIYAGQWIFTQMVQTPFAMDPWYENACSTGDLYTGPILGLARWRFWKEAFDAASESEKVHDDARRLARKAVVFMGAIEQLEQDL